MGESSAAANAIRMLSIDAVQAANSGHPGMPMGMADIATVLWQEFLNHNPANPRWPNRDRFVLSNGHGAMLLYALLHLTGYELSIDDLKQFRQLHAKTPGHPEYGMTPGVETTTGPLGQGFANAVGMALAERTLAATFNQPGFNLIDHYTYVFMGDGCMMEGVSHEAASFAGVQGLGKLIAFWDDNGISIDGEVKDWFADDTPMRFQAYDWHVITDVDGHDPKQLKRAICLARSVLDKPSLICCKTTIGFGSPSLAGTAKSHGAPLGEEEIAKVREALDWPHPPFSVPRDIKQQWSARERGASLEDEWQNVYCNYEKKHPALAKEFQRRLDAKLPADFQAIVETILTEAEQNNKAVATRKASQHCLEKLVPAIPELLGGSADLTGSNNTKASNSQALSKQQTQGQYIYYGVREFAMAAMMNGMSLYGGFIPYGGTFLVFSDYARNAMRLSALMRQRVIYVLTHDSIGLGEDGPTHQPVEHITMLRATPNLHVWRPCDAIETAVAWQAALMASETPSCLILSRQNLAKQSQADKHDQIARGAYILADCEGEPEVILIATGSEVAIAMTAYEQLSQQGRAVRVVSMPCMDVFAQQDDAYQQHVLPKQVSKRIAIEAGSTMSWYRYVGHAGKVIGLDRFGESAPYQTLYQAFDITADHIIDVVNNG